MQRALPVDGQLLALAQGGVRLVDEHHVLDHAEEPSRCAAPCDTGSGAMSEISAESVPVGPRTPRESVAAMRIHAPTERNPKLGRFLEAANANDDAEGPLARPAGDRRAARDVRPLVGAPADRAQPRAAPVPAAAPRRAEVRRSRPTTRCRTRTPR